MAYTAIVYSHYKGCHNCTLCIGWSDTMVKILNSYSSPLTCDLKTFWIVNLWLSTLVKSFNHHLFVQRFACWFLYVPTFYKCVISMYIYTKGTIRVTKSMIAVIVKSLSKIVSYIIFFYKVVYLHKLYFKMN